MAVTQYYAPTHVYFGKDSFLEVGKVLKEAGTKKVLVHFGSGSVVKSGLLKQVEQTLEDNEILFVELGGVQPNPRLSLVRKGIELGRREKVDTVLAVGGGSVLDSSKAISIGIVYDGDVWDFYSVKSKPQTRINLAAVLTLSATGSEMSNSSVITNDEKDPNDKIGLNSDIIRPSFAFLDPSLTYTVSKYQTGCGSVDIIMHTLERYFHRGYCLDYTDANAATLIKTVLENTSKALENPTDWDARANIMWAGSVSHNDFTNAGNETRGDWACHRLEHELSALYDVAHGAGLSSIWASWARYVCHINPSRFAKLGKAVFGIDGTDIEECAQKTIDSFEKSFSQMGMPIGLHQLGLNLKDEDVERLAKKASLDDKKTLGDFMILHQSDMYEIFKAANKF